MKSNDFCQENKTIFKINKRTNPYVMIDTSVAEDIRLTWKAKGLMLYFLSRPDNWEIRRSDLVKRSTDGIDSIKSAIRELIDTGYLTLESFRDDKGKIIKWVYSVFETPIIQPEKPEIQEQIPEKLPEKKTLENTPNHPEVENPLLGYPEVDFPLVDNPLLDTLYRNNNKLNNNKNRRRNIEPPTPTIENDNPKNLFDDDDDFFDVLSKFGLSDSQCTSVIQTLSKDEIKKRIDKIKKQIASGKIKNIAAYATSTLSNQANVSIKEVIQEEVIEEKQKNAILTRQKLEMEKLQAEAEIVEINSENERINALIESATPSDIAEFEKYIAEKSYIRTFYQQDKFNSVFVRAAYAEFIKEKT